MNTNRGFTLPTVRVPLPLDALLEMRATGSVDRDAAIFDAEWTARFKRHVVIVAGPGLGKSTLMTLPAQRYAADGRPVLTV